MCAQLLSRVLFFVTPRMVAIQASLSVEFFRQESWSGQPFPSPGDLPDSGIKPGSPALQVYSLPSDPPERPPDISIIKPQITECLGNPMDRGAWRATVHGVTKGLYDFATQHTHMMRTFKLYSFSSFMYTTVLLTVVTMLKI